MRFKLILSMGPSSLPSKETEIQTISFPFLLIYFTVSSQQLYFLTPFHSLSFLSNLYYATRSTSRSFPDSVLPCILLSLHTIKWFLDILLQYISL